MKKLFIILCCSFLLNSETSSVGAAFRYGPSAKEISLSGATVSIYNPGFNAFSNPAFISQSKKHEFGLSYFSMSLDRSIQSISYSRSISQEAGIGLSFLRTAVTNIKQTDIDNNIIGNLDYWEALAAMSFGVKIDKFSVGGSLKIYQNHLHNNVANGIGLDLGINYSVNDKINVAFCSKNIGAEYKWDFDEDEKIPLITSFGVSYRNKHTFLNDFIFTMQLDYNNSEYEQYRLGLEINPYKMVKFRFGIKESNDIDIANLFYLGLGYEIKSVFDGSANVDYALDPGLMGEGMTHLFSFTFLSD